MVVTNLKRLIQGLIQKVLFVRYYNIVDKLEAVHGGATGAQEQKKTFVYDADHERRRKEQLRRLYNRTQDQLDEEEMLKAELRKIEARKKEREKKTADLQKMIAQADATNQETKKMNKKQKMVPRSGVARQVRSPFITLPELLLGLYQGIGMPLCCHCSE